VQRLSPVVTALAPPDPARTAQATPAASSDPAAAPGTAAASPGVVQATWQRQGPVAAPALPATAAKGTGARDTAGAREPETLPPPRTSNTNEPVWAHLNEVPVREALEMLTRGSTLNIVVSPGVTGKVTANLANLTPQQALDAVVRLADLVAQRDRGIIYVYTAEELRKVGRQPAGLRVYHLNYIRGLDLWAMIRPFLSPSARVSVSPSNAPNQGTSTTPGAQTGGPTAFASGQPGASPTGTGAVGTPPPGGNGATGVTQGPATTGSQGFTNEIYAGGEVLIVQDQEECCQKVDRLVAELDVPPLQVEIEAEIISVTLDANHQAGVNFAVLSGDGNALGVLGNGAALATSVGFPPLGAINVAGQVAAAQAGNGTGFAADEHGIKFGFVGRNVAGFIRALDQFGHTDVLARPRIWALNNTVANVQVGDRLGYSTLTQNLTSTVQQVQFLDTGTLLWVRPFVSRDGMVRMEIHPERSSGQVVNNIPQTNTSEVTTTIMVPDGATMVIGGLIENVDDDQRSGLPGLMNCRWVGALFRQTQHSTTKRELIVLLTPRIITPPPPAAGSVVPPPPACAPVAPPVVPTGGVVPVVPPNLLTPARAEQAETPPRPAESAEPAALLGQPQPASGGDREDAVR
jgi:type II secretory pathway component GspD/PulD (secretin)